MIREPFDAAAVLALASGARAWRREASLLPPMSRPQCLEGGPNAR
jgi:hypothetical protein